MPDLLQSYTGDDDLLKVKVFISWWFKKDVLFAIGDVLLSYYSIYFPVIAVNGLSECFTVAMLSAQKVEFLSKKNSDNGQFQLFTHALFFTCTVFVHIPLSYFCCILFGAKGFIFANTLNSLFRILYNWRYIRAAIGNTHGTAGSIYSRLIPSIHLWVQIQFPFFFFK